MRLFKKKAAEVETVVIDPLLGDETGRLLEAAVAARDWPTIRSVLTTPMTSNDRQWLMSVVLDDPNLQLWINDVVAAERDSTLPLLLKGSRYIRWAWEARGSGGASTVSQDAWKIWFDRLRQAEDCLDEVVEREPRNADAWQGLITLGRARQVDAEERWRRFYGLVAAEPTHFGGNRQMMQGLMRKWSGSHEQMFEFARQRTAEFPGTDLPFLIVEAHLEMWENDGHEYLEKPEIGDEILAAAHQSIWHPDYQRTRRTPLLLNTFCFAFCVADLYGAADRCFGEIGDNLVTSWPWSQLADDAVTNFKDMRDYVRDNLS
ncbi:hypothetical protein GCM10009682_13050 [Luedemannella flava]|uniref:DUF4034 domain-containing protein n=1 Tax=Luedemannella flava TaxID=349316 RepID=A0ABP4XRN4_9ACTN